MCACVQRIAGFRGPLGGKDRGGVAIGELKRFGHLLGYEPRRARNLGLGGYHGHGAGIRVEGLGFRVPCLGCRVWGIGYRV